jgi:hypothetical protein
MPHVIVKLWPGKSEAQKARLAEKITRCESASNIGSDAILMTAERMVDCFHGVNSRAWYPMAR